MRIDFLKHVIRQNIAYFDSDEAASVTTQATSNGNNVNNGISEKLSLTIQGVSTFVTAFIVAFVVQWKLTLITISIIPTIIVVISVCVGIDAKNENQLLSIQSRAGQLAEEVFSTIRTVHAFWLHPLLSRKYDNILGEALYVGLKKSPNYAVMFSTEFFCIYCGYGLAFWQGIRMFARGEIKESGRLIFNTCFLTIVLWVLSPNNGTCLLVHRRCIYRHLSRDSCRNCNDNDFSSNYGFGKGIVFRG